MSEDDIKNADKDQKKLAELEKQLKDQSQEAKKVAPPPSPKKQAPKRTSTRPRSEVANTSSSKGSSLTWLGMVFNFLLIVTLAAAGFWVWQNDITAQKQTQASISEKLAQLTEENSQQANLVSAYKTENEQLNQQLTDLTSRLEAANAQIQSNKQNLGDVSGRRPTDWLLAEADYLVRMAGRKLWLERDVKTAIMMLQSADSRLQDMTDPSLLPIRQLIAEDVQVLQQINNTSVDSVALALSALSKQVSSLPLALPKIPELNDKAAQISDSPADWSENLRKQWRYFVDGLIKYQPRQTPIRPMLDSQQQWLAKEQLRFTLIQAQSAAMSENSHLYQQTLQRAIELLVNHFDLELSSVEQFAESLQNLSQTNLERTFPDSFRSSQPLKDILNDRVDAVFTNKGQRL